MKTKTQTIWQSGRIAYKPKVPHFLGHHWWFEGNHAVGNLGTIFPPRGKKKQQIPKTSQSSYPTQNHKGGKLGEESSKVGLDLRQRLLIRKVEHAGLPASLQLVWMCATYKNKKKHTHTAYGQKKKAKTKKSDFGRSPSLSFLGGYDNYNPYF